MFDLPFSMLGISVEKHTVGRASACKFKYVQIYPKKEVQEDK